MRENSQNVIHAGYIICVGKFPEKTFQKLMEEIFLEILSAILLRIRVCCSAHCCISTAQHGAVFLSVLMRFLVLG